MKNKVLMIGILMINCLIMFFPWFKGINGSQVIYGTIMLENPIAVTCLLFCFIGIWIRQEYGQIIENIGWIGMIVMQIYEFLTWHIRIAGGNIDIQLSSTLAYSNFYLAVICSIISFIIYRVSMYHFYKSQNNHMVCI